MILTNGAFLMLRKKKRYINYDYDEVFDIDISSLSEDAIKQSLKKRTVTSVYATKTIRSGNQLEIEIYPEFTRAKAISNKNNRLPKHKDIQRNLNARNSKKTLSRLINTNFNRKDYFLTLTFESVPESEERAIKDVRNYIARVNRLRKKKGLDNAKYIYVIETSKDGHGIRPHVHMIIEHGLSMDELEEKWTKGRRNNCRRLDPSEDGGLTGLANYLTKEPKQSKYKKKWISSKNLKKPKIRKNHRDFSNRRVNKMVEDEESISSIMIKKFNAEFKDYEIKFNEYNGKYYIYARMYYKEE